MFLFVLIHQQLKIKQMNCFFSLFNKYMKRCDVRICNMISISFVQYVNFPLSARRFFRLGTSFFFTTMKQRKVFVLNNKDTSHVYAYMRITIRICAYNHTCMCV